MDKFNELRNKYDLFIYKNFSITYDDENMNIIFNFEIKDLCSFNPRISINKKCIKNTNINDEFLSYIVFNIGLVEMISYYKAVCPKNILIECGYLNDEQISWFKKLMFNGLGEFFYRNNINISMDDLCSIKTTNERFKSLSSDFNYNADGNLICVGGGKDSCVSLEILKNEINNSCFIINPKTPSIESAKTAGYSDDEIITINRVIDKNLLDLNAKGFLNGHTPFSAIVAFTSYLCAYLNNKKNIILSNESSANEATVVGTNINHQYSKSIEFEDDFRDYINKYFKIDINYFSLLRGLSEFEIGKLFSKYEKYHKVFKSCNLGSKNENWNWCCNCSKCLFVYIILSPFLYKEKLVDIFGEDLFSREDLLNVFKEIIGETLVKPFDCVGTIDEAKYALSLTIKKIGCNNLPYLLKYFNDNYDLTEESSKITSYSYDNNLSDYFNKLVKDEVND